MKVDYLAKTVTFTFEEMAHAQSQLSAALKYAVDGSKEQATTRSCIRGVGDNLGFAGFDRRDID